ncbi:MAG: hypothetical protein ACK50D_06500 [Burkholderiales bacterium]
MCIGYYNGDRKADLLYSNDTTGEVFMYLLNGTSITGGGYAYVEPDLAWKILGP